ncbi:MAG: phytanoyl-CoA dioxygenase family protein [Bacteroidota bacterium]
MDYTVNGHQLAYDAQGSKAFGNDTVLLENADDLSAAAPWNDSGFTVSELPSDIFQEVTSGLRTLLINILRNAGLPVTQDFNLEQYHWLVDGNYDRHLAVIQETKLREMADFPGDVNQFIACIEEICGCPLIARNPFDDASIFHFRVVRPLSGDNNPLHRDVWLEDYDDCINIYLPIAGSNEESSLILIPGSHQWSDSKIEKTDAGAQINGVKFNVPAVTSIDGSFEAIRANPRTNEVLVFSPYLVHGGAINLNRNKTRVSLEMRLWRKQ